MQFRCPVCNEIQGGLSPSHVRKHGFKNIPEFLETFPQLKCYNVNYASKNKQGDTKTRSKRTNYLLMQKGGEL